MMLIILGHLDSQGGQLGSVTRLVSSIPARHAIPLGFRNHLASPPQAAHSYIVVGSRTRKEGHHHTQHSPCG